jgi:outer membrane protein
MKKFFTAAALVICLIVAGNQVNAQAKYGYISTQELISIMPESSKADTTLTQLRDALVQSMRDRENALQASVQKFYDDSAKMAPAVKEVKRTDLQKMYQDLAGEEQRIQQQLQQKQQDLYNPIYKKALDAIQNVAKENGYSFVFERESVLVGPPADNLITLVSKKLGIKAPPASGNPPATAPKTDGKQ